MRKERINVTKTFLPDQNEYQKILSRSWNKSWITNRGELVLELEAKIREKLGVSNVIATTNGTLPLQIAIKTLGIKGDVITTPFSYIATTSSIIWEGCTPIFVDIHSKTFNIDASKIEKAITQNTSAIIATHVFGNPCDVHTISEIAKKYNLKVIYDAAHSFGVTHNGKTIFEYGDISTCSFHATKLFHTGEGGALFTKSKTIYDKLYYQHNFGHKGTTDFHGLGINAKMSELQAALGLAIIPYFDEIVSKRELLYKSYKDKLAGKVQFQGIQNLTNYNYSYMPVVFNNEEELLKVMQKLNENNIFPRRYFYPSLNTIDYVNGEVMPISESIAKRILCLPLYFDLKEQDIDNICGLIKNTISSEKERSLFDWSR